MKKTAFLLLLAACAPPLWAGTGPGDRYTQTSPLDGGSGRGTAVKARLESTTDKNAWVNVEAAISDGHLRLSFRGPWSHGALLYDRDTSLLTVVDDIHKTVLPLTQDTQAALKLIAAVASSKWTDRAGASKSGAKALQLARENAEAFFNGTPSLTAKGVLKRGIPCDDYRTSWQGQRAREVWVADPPQAGMGGDDYDTLRALAHLALGLCGDELAQWGADTKGFEQDFFIPQLPVEAILYRKGKPSGLFEILSVETKAFGPETFTAPAGYQTQSLLDILRQSSK